MSYPPIKNDVGQPAVSRCQVTGEANENTTPPLVRLIANNSHQFENLLASYHNELGVSIYAPVLSATSLDDDLLDGCDEMG